MKRRLQMQLPAARLEALGWQAGLIGTEDEYSQKALSFTRENGLDTRWFGEQVASVISEMAQFEQNLPRPSEDANSAYWCFYGIDFVRANGKYDSIGIRDEAQEIFKKAQTAAEYESSRSSRPDPTRKLSLVYAFLGTFVKELEYIHGRMPVGF